MIKVNEALDRAVEMDRKLGADDPRLRRMARVLHKDGTSLLYESAFLMWMDSEHRWLAVFGSHIKPRVFDSKDLLWWSQYEQVNDYDEYNS